MVEELEIPKPVASYDALVDLATLESKNSPKVRIEQFFIEHQIHLDAAINHEQSELLKIILIDKNIIDPSLAPQDMLIKYEELSKILSYLQKALTTNHAQFNLIANLIIKSDQIWCLKPEALAFFQDIRTQSEAVFNSLLSRIKTSIAPKARNLFLKQHHIESVIWILQKQRDLPLDSLLVLDTYLRDNKVDAKTILNSLRDIHIPYIADQATHAHLLHHTVNHATEINIRVLFLAHTIAGAFASSSATDMFLSENLRFAIELHDYEQKNPGDFATVEAYTANQITQWITSSLVKEAPPEMTRQLIEFLVHYVIILGTTMVYSPLSTMDLSELTVVFEEALAEAHLPYFDESNKGFINQIKIFTHITGIVDKMPAAIYPLVAQQARNPNTNSMQHIRQYQLVKQVKEPGTTSCFNSFIQQIEPYHGDNPIDEINQQAFLLALIPHICMRTELCVTTLPDKAQKLIDFVTICQINHKEMNEEAFFATFDSLFDQFDIHEALSIVFFANIDKEIQFCVSQTSSLQFAAHQLKDSGIRINVECPNIDAMNLQRLSDFYLSCDATDQKELSKILMLNTVLQAGTIYNETPTAELFTIDRPPSQARQQLKNAVRLSQAVQAFYHKTPAPLEDEKNETYRLSS